MIYRGEKKGLQIWLSYSQAGPGKKAKQGQEEISRNHIQTKEYIELCTHGDFSEVTSSIIAKSLVTNNHSALIGIYVKRGRVPPSPYRVKRKRGAISGLE